jgi:hypothetical protein
MPLQGRHASTKVCDHEVGGLDTLLADVGTALFWLSIPAIIHLCLKGEP